MLLLLWFFEKQVESLIEIEFVSQFDSLHIPSVLSVAEPSRRKGHEAKTANQRGIEGLQKSSQVKN